MKKYLIRVSFYVLGLIILHIIAAFQADGYTDPFYLRFASSKQQSLILGTSRAAQALQPAIFDSVLGHKATPQMYNFAFTLGHSPYGKVYFEAIKAKLAESSQQGTFIVTVDPWSVSSDTEDPNDERTFKENDLCLGNTKVVNLFPNFFYLKNNYPRGWLNLFSRPQKSTFLHHDGWLEVSVPMDSASIAARDLRSIDKYSQEYVGKYKLSDSRMAYLDSIVSYLLDRGSVYLVRLPVDLRLLEMEMTYLPRFDSLMMQFADSHGISYLSYSCESAAYQYVDANHLYKNSGAELSKKLAEFISHTPSSPFH